MHATEFTRGSFILIDWIASDPTADGVLVTGAGGHERQYKFIEESVAANQEAARTGVVFSADIDLSLPENADLVAMVHGERCEVVLTRGGRPCSNRVSLNKLESLGATVK